MAYGSTHLQRRETPDLRHGWLAALRRGVILGVVVSLHLGLLALLLGPVTPRWSTSDSRPEHHDALRIRLLAEAARARRANPMPRRLFPARPIPATPIPRRMSVAKAAPTAAAEPPLTALAVEPPAIAGDYHSPLLAGGVGMRSPGAIPRLPGSDAERVRGFALDEKPSLRQVVRAMAKANRCKYESMKMERSTTQFVTRQLMERALEADGCGPQVPHTANDHMVDAISHQAIFGD